MLVREGKVGAQVLEVGEEGKREGGGGRGGWGFQENKIKS